MPRSGSLRAQPGFTSRIPPPTESGTTVQVTPAGMEPTGSPLPSSVTNSSPSPPRVTLVAPTARATRNSGSPPPGARAPGGLAQPAATTRRLASASFVQRRIELGDGEIEVGIRVRIGDESRLERGGRQVHPAGQRG